MAWPRKMSRRKKTTLTVVGLSALAATVAWVFWADISKSFRTPSLGLGKGTVKNPRFVKEDLRKFADPNFQATQRADYIKQLRADGYTEAEIASALTTWSAA